MNPFSLVNLASIALRYWWAAAIAALVVLLALQSGTLDSTRASLKVARAEITREKARTAAWEASYRQAEANRLTERETATTATIEADARCDARVATARQSGNAIRTIIERPVTHDQATGCPVRERVPADRLRDALKPTG
jgi:hypothetical protein